MEDLSPPGTDDRPCGSRDGINHDATASLTSAWRPMKKAPKDGTTIRARGREWGDPNGKWFEVEALWEDRRWTDAAREWSYHYLEEWQPLDGAERVPTTQA